MISASFRHLPRWLCCTCKKKITRFHFIYSQGRGLHIPALWQPYIFSINNKPISKQQAVTSTLLHVENYYHPKSSRPMADREGHCHITEWRMKSVLASSHGNNNNFHSSVHSVTGRNRSAFSIPNSTDSLWGHSLLNQSVLHCTCPA